MDKEISLCYNRDYNVFNTSMNGEGNTNYFIITIIN